MTETKYNMQFTESELKLLQNALHSVECNEKKLLNKIENKLNTINTKKQIDEYKKEHILKKVEEEQSKRIDIFDKGGKHIERIDKINKTELYDKIKSVVEDKGYVFKKDQLYILKEGLVNYVIEKNTFGLDIKSSKGKTDMLILSVSSHSFGSGVA